MGCLRCSNCGISYPHQHRFMRCPVCGGQTSYFSNVDPDPDWEYSVALKRPTVGEAQEAAADVPDDDDPYWWRAEQMHRAGFTHEQAMVLARRQDVDLHDACDLVGKAGADLAYEILS